MAWNIDETKTLVNGREETIEPNEGETLADYIKRIGQTYKLSTVDVRVDGSEVNQGDSRASQMANDFDTIEVSRHTTAG